jgi:threonine dehydratase
MTPDYLEKILLARVYEVARESALELAPQLSERLGCTVLLKREDEQPTFSFKIRGAYNKMAGLDAADRARGVIAASAGNHAQGVSLAARKLGCSALIVMPVTTPSIKVRAVRALGATVVLHGDSYDDAAARARVLADEQGRVFVHPYDDPEVIAGQGTVGLEILRQRSAGIDAVFVPVGGGGLIAGIAAYIKRLRPSIRVVGVEPVDAAAMARSLEAGRRVTLDQVGTFADGVAVKRVGEETFRLCSELVDEMILVDSDAICAAIKDVFEDTRSIMEPAGALSVAGLKAYAAREARPAGVLVAVTSGANMNFDRLRHVSERAEIGEEREALFAVTIPERPGSLRAFAALLGPHNITEFNYRYSADDAARVFVGVSVAGRAEARELAEKFRAAGLETLDLSDNEMAKLHVRHMVGGHPGTATDEVVHRFEFPERPGALIQFLDKMSGRWNISLFHYRNHGADYGRVLIGMQVSRPDRAEFERFLAAIGYPCVEETDNPVYRSFLA